MFPTAHDYSKRFQNEVKLRSAQNGKSFWPSNLNNLLSYYQKSVHHNNFHKKQARFVSKAGQLSVSPSCKGQSTKRAPEIREDTESEQLSPLMLDFPSDFNLSSFTSDSANANSDLT